MSSALNPAAVTLTLVSWLTDVCHEFSGAATVSAGKLDAIAAGTTSTNLFLYQIEKNPGYASFDLATRNSKGEVVAKPLTAIDLSYLVSFSGQNEQASNALMGYVIRAIHGMPGLSRARIQAAIAGTPIAAATLADQEPAIKLTMPSISLDELSKIWGMFSGSNYCLSIHLCASTVVLESDFDPEPALPVRSFAPGVVPNLGPSLESVVSKGLTAADGIETGATLVISGKNLGAPGLQIKLDSGESLTPTPILSPIGAVEVTLPASVPAGIRQLGAETITPNGPLTSGILPFVLRPKLASATKTTAKNVRLVFTPSIGVNQSASAVFSLVGGSTSDQFRIDLPSSGRPFVQAVVDCAAIPNGRYFVRLRVDGAESLLSFHDTNPTIRPEVTL
jgi:Pvc16 N-terminal domain